jgi:hypothetical protein
MARQRVAIAWIACLAVLFNAFAMPMASAMQQSKDPVQQLLWGSFCSSNGANLKTIALGKLEIPAPQQDDRRRWWRCRGMCRSCISRDSRRYSVNHTRHCKPPPRASNGRALTPAPLRRPDLLRK